MKARFSLFCCTACCTALLLCTTMITPPQIAAMPKASSLSNAPILTGKVTETMNSGGYTYMLVDNGAGAKWVAIPESEIIVGSEVRYYDGMIMENFASKTLNRTFDTIVFSAGLAQGDAPKTSQAAAETTTPPADDSFAAAVNAEKGAAADQPAMSPHSEGSLAVSSGSAGAVVPQEELKIDKAPDDNSFTVGEIFAKAEELNGKKVVVRGKVVKFSPQIMGRNWVHIQDGSGDPMQNSHDLVITTSEVVENDTIVTFEGVLAAKKDFGFGYKYDALVEEATSVK